MMISEGQRGSEDPVRSPNDNTVRQTSSDLAHRQMTLQNPSGVSAVFLKSILLQRRAPCWNLCQIITPLFCLFFTWAVQLLTGQLFTNTVGYSMVPQPLSLPVFSQVESMTLRMSCQQGYFIQGDKTDFIRNGTLHRYCPSTGMNTPVFTQVNSTEQAVNSLLVEADMQPFERGVDLKTDIPDGLIRIHESNSSLLEATLSINDFRLPEYHRNNGVTKLVLGEGISGYLRVTEGMMGLMEKVTRSYLTSLNPKQMLNSFIIYMPFSGEDNTFLNKMTNVVGSGLYPFGLSILMPLLLYSVVSQKEDKLRQLLRLNGLTNQAYWTATFAYAWLLSTFAACMFFALGRYAFAHYFFVGTSFWVYFCLTATWNIAQISIVALLQTVINSGRTAAIIGYMLAVFSTLLGGTLSSFIYASPAVMPWGLILYPPFALCRAIYLLGQACAVSCIGTFENVDSQIVLCMTALLLWLVVFILTVLFESVLMEQQNLFQPNIIPLKIANFFKYIANSNRNLSNDSTMNLDESIEDGKSIQAMPNQNVDFSVEEAAQLAAKALPQSCAMVVKGVSKTYAKSSGKTGYTALKPVSFCLQQGEIFGLLGPNGAGKTTMISILTGLSVATTGTAWLHGHSIGTQAATVRTGVCFQFDVLWNELTVQEHLRIFARLKGLLPETAQYQIRSLLQDFQLAQWSQTRSVHLSGGMKRRLSIAIAMLGKPSVVFLDEPSSGLDPIHRRALWNVLLRCKKYTTIFLTTHLMEEAEALCDRVAVIHKGVMQCIGRTQSLKERFGQGYTVTLSSSKVFDQTQHILGSLMAQLETQFNSKGEDSSTTKAILKVPKQRLGECIQLLLQQKQICWSVQQPTLNDVLKNFIK